MSSVSRPIAEIEVCCWPACRESVYDDPASPPFCGVHLVRCAAFVSQVLDINLFTGQQGFRADQMRREQKLAAASVVYYVRLGRHVKIGTTVNLKQRIESFRTVYPLEDVELLAAEPGGPSLERERHRQFGEERISAKRELFNPSRRLLAHIEEIKAA